MNEYKIFSLEEENLDVVLLTSIDDPYFILDDIYNELKSLRGSSFSIVLDLLLRNGYSFNRFALINYDSQGKHDSKIINTRDVSEMAKSQVRKYLIRNRRYLDESSLSDRIKNFILSA
ncbi:type II toxin-antitoxin system RnlB family antitoxin [Fusibacter bizertensis]|uniref:Type II toxin-antitoxin system RnlB family antitoxin n=1 Tax=Fusibacter bizertensis TaxID=1488331 RepID=A0ABT6NEL8_9FIRM|nr:type II toxin-antitoxin system RnlB family antitoxin [Fusibacter bizertensis]MDH8678871.1 type II toxin-antitoxin system RnlB family antitoxin [Fusibacter bizertensis]